MILSIDTKYSRHPRLADSAKYCFVAWGLRQKVNRESDHLTTLKLRDWGFMRKMQGSDHWPPHSA
jgi:hypothetical protein